MLLVALATFGMVAAQVDASQLRRLAPSVTSFATDGLRYAAWQDHPAAPIVVLDTLDGSEREIETPGCVLEEMSNAHESGEGGLFLLSCFKEPGDGCFEARLGLLFRCGEKPLGEEPTHAEVEAHGVRVQRLLDVKTGVSMSLRKTDGNEWDRATWKAEHQQANAHRQRLTASRSTTSRLRSWPISVVVMSSRPQDSNALTSIAPGLHRKECAVRCAALCLCG